ncbi:MAG TPA: TonB-dependent receptor [Steroidobacteraceae bacterium]|nr:TonB-dependent receptor [Steroidobacteraceae bacterium]
MALTWSLRPMLPGVGLLGFVSMTPALAADTPPDDALDQVIVTATRLPQRANEALESVLLIDRIALQNSLATDVGEVLQQHAGLDVARTGGPGQPLSLFIRGTNSDHAIVMIDGVRINSGTLGGAPLQNLAPELFERIEVVEGPRSAIYGTDAIGGVVNLITRSTGSSGLDAMLGYGRYDTGQFAVDGTYATPSSHLSAALAGQQSTGFPTFVGDTTNAAYRNLTGILTGSTTLDGVELGALYWRAAGASEYANPIYNGDYTAFTGFTPLGEHFFDSAFAVHANGNLTEAWRARLTVSRVIDQLSQDQADPYSYPTTNDHDLTRRDTLDLQNDVTLGGDRLDQRITFGLMLVHERTDAMSYGTGYAVATSTQTYYLQDQIESGPHRLLLAAGDVEHPAFGNHATWNAEYGYRLSPNLLFIGSAGTAFRAPTATDRFGYGGTPDLKPESSRNFEVGLKARLNPEQDLTLAAFQNTINDLIVFVPDPTNSIYGGENQNLNRARIRGVQLVWDARIDPWTIHAEGSLQDPRDLSPGATQTQLERRAKQSFSLTGAYRFTRGDVGLEVYDAGPRTDVDVVTGARGVIDGGYVLVALRGRLLLSPQWSLSARLDNALDRRYALANGYNTAGRAASIALRYSLR